MTDSSTAGDGRQPMTAERLRRLVQLALTRHPDVRDAKPVFTIYQDRIALAVEDYTGALWRIQLLKEPVR